MNLTRRNTVLACALLAGLSMMPLTAQTQAPPGADQNQGVPKDLRPLLAPRQSEMRLVTLRYLADRQTLSGNFLGGAPPGGRGRGGAPTTTAIEPLSPNRIARLKRFDLDWQAALGRINTGWLSLAARADLDALNATILSNLARLDADAEALAQVSPLVPFAPAIVHLVEARIRLDDLDAAKAAGVVTAVTKEVDRLRAGVEAGLAGSQPDALRVGKTLAMRSAVAVDTLRGALAEWFTFYNGYDPLFTWWVGLPHKHADASLQACATLLRGKVATADLASPNVPAPAAAPIPPAPAPKFASVPDLQELLALPQDEMTAIVQRFRGAPASGRGGPEAGPGQGRGAVVRDRKHYEDWLAALQTLGFNALSRNAQVDYLFIRKTAEQHIARSGVTLPANPPRKTDSSGIPGAARGRQGLIFDLQDEFIPYTPEELIALADKEFAWCESEMKKASRQMGMGDDWKKAVEAVKAIHPPPGGQVGVVRDLMFEAVDFLRAKDLLTVPAVAAESLHMIMMTPERQLVNPFFTGGSLISVSSPTDTMEYESRIQSLRGNNTPFSHATAFHEMIPGHNLVFYTNARFTGYRATLLPNTPFHGEGWPLYWELLLYDLGFHDTPERKIGALFWRMHRCARIIFSLRFHMGDWSPQECIDFLVNRLGHERDNATAEVRRSFQGGYGPLYQAAYLLGGLQLRALRRELVATGRVGNKAFHDEILRQGSMPIALLRLVLSKQTLTRDVRIDWKFYGERPGA
jgi:hypothetical protein